MDELQNSIPKLRLRGKQINLTDPAILRWDPRQRRVIVIKKQTPLLIDVEGDTK